VIVLDTSFLVAFHNQRDSQHAPAQTMMDQFLANRWGKGLLLEYVFLEITTVLMVRRDLATAARVGRILLDADELEFVPCSDYFLQTTDVFSNQRGTRLSFTDAAICAVARDRAEGLLLTFDMEFRKIGSLHVLPD